MTYIEENKTPTYSTPLSVKVSSFSGHFSGNSHKKAQPEVVRPQIAKDMEGSLISCIPFADFVRETWGFDIDRLHLPEWNKDKPFELDARLLAEYDRCKTETQHYFPYMNMLMEAVLSYDSAMKDLKKSDEVDFPCGVFFDARAGNDIVTGDGDIERKPDGSITSVAGHHIFQDKRNVPNSIDKNHFRFLKLFWCHVLAWLEFKYDEKKSNKGNAVAIKGAPSSPADTETIGGSSASGRYPSTRSSSKRPAPDDDREPVRKRTRVKAASKSSPPERTQPPAYRMKQKVQLTGDEVQAVEYAHETLRTGRRLWSTGVFVDKFEMSLWFIDRMGAICSNTIDFRHDPTLFLLTAVAIASASLEQFGFDPAIQPANTPPTDPFVEYDYKTKLKTDSAERLQQERFDKLQGIYEASDSCAVTDLAWTDLVLRLPIHIDAEDKPLPLTSTCEPSQPGSSTDTTSPPANTTSSPADITSSPADTTSSPTSSPETTPPAIITFTIQADPLHLQPGVIGRGTSVFPVEPPSDPKYKDLPQELVAKRSWPPEDRLGEDVIIAHIRSLITPRWKKHIPDVRGSLTQTMKDVKSPRKNLTDIARREIERWKADVRTQNGDLTADELEDAQLYNAFIGDAHENRVFRTLICVRYIPLQEVRNCQEFAKVFLDVVQGMFPVLSCSEPLSDVGAYSSTLRCLHRGPHSASRPQRGQYHVQTRER